MTNEHLSPRDTPIAAGEAAPDFTLPDQDKNDVNLYALLDQTGADVVLSFYPLDFSSVCSTEMGCFTRDIDKFRAKKATVLGISCDSFYAHKVWREQLGIGIPLLADMHRAVCRAYGFYFPPLNVAGRGTVVVGPDKTVKWVSARELGVAIDNEALLGAVG